MSRIFWLARRNRNATIEPNMHANPTEDGTIHTTMSVVGMGGIPGGCGTLGGGGGRG